MILENICKIPIQERWSFFKQGLEGVLNNTIDGKIVLLRKHNLNNDARQRLVKEIINYLIGKLGVDSVKAFMLEYAADEISKIFPNEVRETYYIPYLPKSPSVLKKAAQGKLWSRFVNVRSAIKTAENSVKKDKGILTIKDYPNKDAEIELLNTIIEPKDKVVALWRDTYEQRRLALRSSSVTVQELFDRYAALSTSMGPELAERLADYGRLLGGSQPALDGRQRDLDRIQDLFPHDYLGLHISEPSAKYSIKTKSFRKKSLGDLTIMESNRACTRIFLMEAPCAMSPAQMHLNAKPRHLFLFSDLLLVAKPRSGGSFKLKESVRVSELWMAPCAESETGFLLGWPSPARTYLVTFCTQAARDSWWRELRQALSAQLRLEPPVTNIKVVYRDPLSGTECSKTLGVGPETSSTDVARLALDESRTCDISYTLYTRDRDNAPCPLLGCERPHSIQLARLRQSLCAEEGFDLQHCNKSRIPCDIVFELRPTIKQSPRKTPLKLFRKQSCGRVFGVPLSRLCANNSLPPVILSCLRALFQRGPHTQGIFRRCASARALRELKEKADSQGAAVCEEIANTPALLLGALLKDFLRCLPEPLLCGNAQEWLNAATSGRLDLLRRLLSNLPRENHMLLRHVICVLYNIANRSRFNLMSAANLGVCVGPSMLWESMQNAPLRTLPTLIETLINNCQALFGSQIVSLLGEVANDSGAEESDSLHSLGLSLDSVELSKDQKSLSRDSGLTLSEDDRESPGLNYHTATFHRSDWARQAARMRSMDNTTSWIEEDEAFCASNESLCSPPIPPRRPPPLRHLPPVHIPPMYRPPPPPPPTYATARLLLVTDAESESYV